MGNILVSPLAGGKTKISDIADGTDGELITWDSSGAATTVGVGTADQVLTSNGAGAEPTFQAAAGGAYTLLQTQTASTSTTIDFTTNLDSTYKSYLITGVDIILSLTEREMFIQVSEDAGTSWESTAGDYRWIVSLADSAGTDTRTESEITTNIRLTPSGYCTGYNAGDSTSFQLIVYNPAGANKTNMEGTVVGDQNADDYSTVQIAGQYTGTAAVTGIRFLTGGDTNYASGTFKLYGIS